MSAKNSSRSGGRRALQGQEVTTDFFSFRFAQLGEDSEGFQPAGPGRIYTFDAFEASPSPWVSDFGTDRYGLLQVFDCLLELSELPVNATQNREHPRLNLKVPSAPGGGKSKGVEIPSESKVSSEVKEAPHGIG